jgi:YtkA-like
MKRAFIFVVALALTGLATPVALAATPGPPSMTVQFSPNPPKTGAETITVHLSDIHHRPVNGATVSIATSMPAMSMSGPTVRAISKGNGTYVAALKLNFATRWSFAAIAQAGGRTARRVVQQDVK